MQMQGKHFLADLNLFSVTVEKINAHGYSSSSAIKMHLLQKESLPLFSSQKMLVLYLILLYKTLGFLQQPTLNVHCS